MILDRPPLGARDMSWDEAWSIFEAFEELDAEADFAGSLPWLRAAYEICGPDQLRPIVFTGENGQIVGCITAISMRGPNLRISVLRVDHDPAAACLSFIHKGRYKAFMSGWNRCYHKLDLGRQVIWHQILTGHEGEMREIDLLGGDLNYKREFGLTARATRDVTVTPNSSAFARQRFVESTLGLYRGTRRWLRATSLTSGGTR